MPRQFDEMDDHELVTTYRRLVQRSRSGEVRGGNAEILAADLEAFREEITDRGLRA